MKDRVYGSSRRDDSINPMSNRIFTKSDCMSWLDSIEDESVNLWICYDEQTEVMTDSGWKFFKDVDIKKDKFLSMNPDDKTIDYLSAIHKIDKEYTGKMYDFKTDKVHITVTPEHKMITEHQWEDGLFFEKAEDIYHKGNRYFQKNGGNWIGRDTGISSDFAYLLGIYITDGACTMNHPDYPHLKNVIITQKKNSIREKIKNKLEICGIKYNKRENGFYICSPDYKKFEPLCNKSERRVPDVIKYAKQEVILNFLEGVIDGDGDNAKEITKGLFGSRRIAMGNLKLLEDIQELLYKVNCSGRIIKRDCTSRKVLLKSENRYIETKKPTYILSISNEKNNKVSKTDQQFKNENWVDYDGKVYCVSLPKWHTLLVKKGFTCPTWQANCDPPYNVLTGNMKNKNGAALFHSRYTAKISPSESDFEKELVSSRFEIAIPWEEQRKLEDYKEWCYKWYCKAHAKLADDSFMFIFWSMRYLSLAYQIFDVNRVIFWQQPNMVSTISGDFSYDITPIIVIRKGNPRLIKEAGLWDKSSVLNFTKPQGNYIKDKLCHNCFVAGTKVFVNNTWKNIEDVNVGDMTSYGKVREKMMSKSNNIYELTTELGITEVTGNHPLLIIDRKGVIKWEQVQNITEENLVLQNQDIIEPQRIQENSCTLSYGNNIMGLNQTDSIYTMLTELKPTIELKTSNLSHLAYIANVIVKKQEIVNQDTKYAIDVVENYHSQTNTGIKAEDTIKDHVKSVYCKPVKILSLRKKEMQEDENLDVYNLTVENNNFYDVKNIGIAHNCQKPRALLEHLVWLSGADQEGNIIGDFFAGSGSLLRAVNKADVILCDMNREYYDKFFDIYVSDERVYRCKIIDDKKVK